MRALSSPTLHPPPIPPSHTTLHLPQQVRTPPCCSTLPQPTPGHTIYALQPRRIAAYLCNACPPLMQRLPSNLPMQPAYATCLCLCKRSHRIITIQCDPLRHMPQTTSIPTRQQAETNHRYAQYYLFVVFTCSACQIRPARQAQQLRLAQPVQQLQPQPVRPVRPVRHLQPLQPLQPVQQTQSIG